jgi:hypothetical protein
LLFSTLVAVGCSGADDPFNQPKRQVNPEAFGVSSGETPPPPPSAPPAASAVPSSGTSSLPPPPPPPAATTAATPASAAGAPAAAPAAEAPSANAVKAEAGVGRKGRGYGAGMITTPIAAYFSIRERLAFDQVTHAMDLYKATNEHAPKSHEEFMEKIIKENGVKLPQLPAGERYLYDPKTEQLMVERPAPDQ